MESVLFLNEYTRFVHAPAYVKHWMGECRYIWIILSPILTRSVPGDTGRLAGGSGSRDAVFGAGGDKTLNPYRVSGDYQGVYRAEEKLTCE